MKRKTILILGISSFVGSNLANGLKENYKIIGTYLNNPVNIPGVLCLQCDVLSKDALQFLVYSFRPDATIYAAGLSGVDDCARHEKYADAVNTIGVFNASTFTERYKSKFIYISTSYVFAGHKKIYHESDTPDPTTALGRSKSSAEFYVQKSCLDYLIFRCCPLYGRSFIVRQQTWLEAFEYRYLHQKSAMCDTQVLHGFIDIAFLVAALELCLEKGISNRLFQLSTSDVMTFYDFARTYCSVFKISDSFLVKGNWGLTLDKSEQNLGDLDLKKYFQLSSQNIETFLQVEVPTITQSLETTFEKFNGIKGKKSKSSKGPGITYI